MRSPFRFFCRAQSLQGSQPSLLVVILDDAEMTAAQVLSQMTVHSQGRGTSHHRKAVHQRKTSMVYFHSVCRFHQDDEGTARSPAVLHQAALCRQRDKRVVTRERQTG